MTTAESGEYLAAYFAVDETAALRNAKQFIRKHIDPDTCGVMFCTPARSRQIQREVSELMAILDGTPR